MALWLNLEEWVDFPYDNENWSEASSSLSPLSERAPSTPLFDGEMIDPVLLAMSTASLFATANESMPTERSSAAPKLLSTGQELPSTAPQSVSTAKQSPPIAPKSSPDTPQLRSNAQELRSNAAVLGASEGRTKASQSANNNNM